MRRRSTTGHPRCVAPARDDGSERTRLGHAFLITILLLLAASQLLAQARRIPFDRLTTADGLSHDSVNAVVQDHSGFIWFGTQDGLTRYDGVRTVVFRHRPADLTSLSDNWVWALLEDSRRNLWVGTGGGGVNLWDPQRRGFLRFQNDEADPRSLSHDAVRTIFEDREGNLWIGTEGGLNRFNPERGDFTRYMHNPIDPGSLSNDDVRAILEDRTGRLWIGTYGGGLNLLDRETGIFTHYRHDENDPSSLSDDSLRELFEDAEGNFWIGTYEGGLNRMDRDNGTFERFRHDADDPTSLSDDRVRAVLQDSKGVVWVGTDDGLNEWLPESRSFGHYTSNPADPASLSDDSVQSLYQDRGGVLWVTTRAGASKWNVNTGSFNGYRADPSRPHESLLENSVWSLADDGKGTLWVGTYGALTRMDLTTGRTRHYLPGGPGSLADDRVFSLLVDGQGVVWVGTFEGGLHRLNPDGETFTRFQHDPGNPRGLASNKVASIYEDREGVLWIGTYGGGLARFDRASETFVAYRHDPRSVTSLSDDRVLTLFEDSAGVLWVGTHGGGLNGFDRRTGTFTRFRNDPQNEASLSADGVASITEDRQRNLWVGTMGGGLNKWTLEDRQAHRVAFRHFRESEEGGEGLSNGVVYGILQDEAGLLWISTNNGLLRFDPVTEIFRRFDDTHGLQSREFNSGAYHRSVTGEMFFGGNQGFNSFFPDSIQTNTHQPPVVLTSLQKVNRELESETPLVELGEIELSHKDYVVSFEFAALDFTAPKQNRYAYKLDGFDEDWVEAGNLNRATYTNLDPGSYTFRVRGSNSDGVWSANELELGVRVIPPWWRTWWAYAIYGFLAIALVARYLFDQARRNEIAEKRRLTLEAQVRERTSELAERNQELQRAIQQLELASVTDSLTGLRNRRFLVNTIERDLALVHRLRRDREEHGVEGPPTDSLFLIFDLDGFKDVNDSYGHSAGDRVLLQVRDLLEDACRKSDSIIRWGGDEFLVVARHTDREAAEKLAERLRASVENHDFSLGNGQTAKLSCSIGFAFYPFLSNNPRLFNWEQVMAVADRALYVAKKSGRNAWVGVYETEKTRQIEPLRLMPLINGRIEELVAEGKLELRTSIPDHDHLVWAWA